VISHAEASLSIVLRPLHINQARRSILSEAICM
jgi:hypothetical protein